ncbi:MAG: bis(5'-nucleosyl)-tetraphosphatase [candidate division WOR-3 bacterium]
MTRFERSAGVIVFRIADGKPLYLLLKHPSYWGFPKGHLEDGETEEDTARRELAEEAGLSDVEIIPDFHEVIEYWFRREGHTIHKKVIFFLARANDQALRLSHEHEDGGWFEFEEAMKRARYRNQRALLNKAHERIKELMGSSESGSQSI